MVPKFPSLLVLKEAGIETVSNVLRAYDLVCVTTGLSIIIFKVI